MLPFARLARLAPFALLASACGGSDPVDVEGPAEVTLANPSPVLVPGQTSQLSWIVKDAGGATLPNEPVTFSATPAAVATVSAAGVVSAVSPGTATITGRAGNATGQAQVVVREGGILEPSGGTITGFSGAIAVVAPAGAVTAPTPVEFATAVNPVLDPSAAAGSIYAVTVTGSLAGPITLRIRYSTNALPLGIPNDQVGIRSWSGAAWTGVAGGSHDAGTTTASGSMTATGIYSVGWAAPEAPCASVESRQFDFWLGSWDVSTGGPTIARSDITLVPGGCAVLEWFRPNGGGEGRSINFYNPATAKWYQTYVDNTGARLVLSGTLQGGSMIMLTPQQGQSLERWTWSVEGNGNVRQVGEASNNGGASFGAPHWNGLYTRR